MVPTPGRRAVLPGCAGELAAGRDGATVTARAARALATTGSRPAAPPSARRHRLARHRHEDSRQSGDSTMTTPRREPTITMMVLRSRATGHPLRDTHLMSGKIRG